MLKVRANGFGGFQGQGEPFAACVTREPKEVFTYSDTVRAAETLFYSNQNPFTKDDRRFMFETGDNDLDN
jgi:hypothetical protein